MGPAAPAWAPPEGALELRRAGMTWAQMAAPARPAPPVWLTAAQLEAVSMLRASRCREDGEGVGGVGLAPYAAPDGRGGYLCLPPGTSPDPVALRHRAAAEELSAGWAAPEAVLEADAALPDGLEAPVGAGPLPRPLAGTGHAGPVLYDPGTGLLAASDLDGADAHPRPALAGWLPVRVLLSSPADLGRAWLDGAETLDEAVAAGASRPALRLPLGALPALSRALPVRAAGFTGLAPAYAPLAEWDEDVAEKDAVEGVVGA